MPGLLKKPFQHLEAVTQQNSVLEDRVGHLDDALKECVRQLRQAREDQEQKIYEALVERTEVWDSIKFELENRILELETQLKASKGDSPSMKAKLVSAEQENAALKRQLIMCTEELEVRSIERDLSTQSAEIASKQHLDSIKKVARLEAECRKLRALSRKASASWQTPPAAIQEADHRSVTSLVFVDSLADSQSDHGDRLLAIENDLQDFHGSSGKPSSLELNEKELSCSDSWASALIAELDQFKNEKVGTKNFTVTASKNLYLMDDFLEMEKLAASENGGLQNDLRQEVGDGGNEMLAQENGASCLKEELEALQHRVSDLEEQVENLTAEKVGLETSLAECQGRLEVKSRRLMEVEQTLLEIQQQLASAKDANRRFEVDFEAICVQKETVEMELKTANASINALKTNVDMLQAKIEEERTSSANVQVKCQELEEMLAKRDLHYQEAERLKAANANYEIKMRQEKELAVAAGKLAECQNTIASLGRQLKALANFDQLMLETNMVDPNQIGSPTTVSTALSEYSTNVHVVEPTASNRDGESPSSTSSSSSSSLVNAEKTKNGFGRFFPRNLGSIQIESGNK
ncbi:filament-like plant protein isoform X2 [Nymphaea colorata]|uniref:filament-like plant protein isoform X2 n=1 Tax=Nymphaea colorata TaxID=210225 RepID=UPI00129D6802|nr:filament-like plant protein isoform X2 [Nymphaea colorata]